MVKRKQGSEGMWLDEGKPKIRLEQLDYEIRQASHKHKNYAR